MPNSPQEFGTASTIELVQGGSQIAVTKENRLRYIDLVANFKLNIQLKSQCEAFFMGLADIISVRRGRSQLCLWLNALG